MRSRFNRGTVTFLGGCLLVFVVFQYLFSAGILNDFWYTLIRIGAVMAIVSIGLNLIYGFNGQFSLGQWGFYAIGAYTAADITYRWTQLNNTSGLMVILLGVAFSGAAILLLGKYLNRVRGLDAMSAFAIYLLFVVLAILVGVWIARPLIPLTSAALSAMPEAVSGQIVFFLAVILGGLVAAEVSFLFGLPILTLGSDYFGIATLGFTIIIKVLLDNTDAMFGLTEMKGARGMVGIPKDTTWFWVFFFLFVVVVVTRNILQSSTGRAIVSVREDETAAKAMGIDVGGMKTLTFVIGSLFAGLAGGLYAHINGFLHPSNFNFIRSFDPMIIIVFGGLGSITGTVFASFAWALVLEGFLRILLPAGFETWRFVVYPLLLLVMMLLRPKGLLGTYEIAFLRSVMPPRRKREALADGGSQPAAVGEPMGKGG